MTSDPIARYLAGRGSRLSRRQRLRLMTSGDVLDMALRAYRHLGWTFLRLTVVPALFCLGAVAFVISSILPALGVTHHVDSVSAQVGEMVVTVSLGLFLGGPLFILGLSYISAIVVHLTSDFMLGNMPRPDVALRTARALIPTLFRLTLREILISVSGIAAAVGIMAVGALLSQQFGTESIVGGLLTVVGCFGIIAGLFIFGQVVATHALAPAICVLEESDPRQCAKRSVYLLKPQLGHLGGTPALWGTYFFMLFVGAIEYFGFFAVFQLVELQQHLEDWLSGVPLRGLILEAFGMIPSFLVIWTVLPIWAACITIVYYDRRIRLEGYDIEALAEDIGNGRTSRFDL